jgi:hypothetical protein
MAQPTQAMEMLRKWRDDKTTVTVTSGDEIDRTISDTSAHVLCLDQSSLILRSIEDSPQTTTVDLQNVSLSIPESVKGIEIRWPDGKNTVILEA